MAEPGRRVRSFVRVVGGMLLGIGLSAIYLLPAMATQQYVLFAQMKSGFYYFANQFLLYGPRLDDARLSDYLDYLGIIASLMLFVTIAAWKLGRETQQAEARRESTFWLLAAGLAFFMQLYPSKPLWDWLTVLQEVQFPGRFNTVLTLAMVVPVAFWIRAKEMSSVGREPAMWAIVALLVVLNSMPVLKRYPQYGLWSATPTLDGLISGVNEVRSKVRGSGSAEMDHDAALLEAARISRYNYFLPRWSNPELFAETQESVREMEHLASRRDHAYLADGEGSVMVKRWQPPHIDLSVTAGTGMQVGLLQFYYPGWVARLDGGTTRLEVEPSRPDGLLKVEVPPGTHSIVIEREPLPEERAGQLISGAALLLLGAIVARRPRWVVTA